ncbi:TIGR04222 domain-containing membrane protein [Streptomonospora sp. PA3]|uniref:TIGR04222 domain-containing membrane protein n=1 Tax=Streptomonospora sp. PA3 TaxID=2607326 RepID=UPI0012DD6D62|nr:TIGR04222 domain-containing membrane protein [Streptomonospora sp. PA3]MUL40809.1 TIGR04222 domain-containing membrane protein [Streptomonospora sp. PA3]
MVAGTVLSATLGYLAIAACYLATRWSYARIRRAGPQRPPVGPEDLDAFDLAMLAGGRQRMGEVALAELYLSGRAVARGHGLVSRPQQAEPRAARLSPAPFARLLDVRLESSRSVAADLLVRLAAKADPATSVLWRLRRLGLFLAPERLGRVSVVRHAAWGLHMLIGAVGVLAGGGAVLWAMIPEGERIDAVPLVFAAVLIVYPSTVYVLGRLIGGMQGAVATAAAVTAAAVPVVPQPRILAAGLGLLAGWSLLHGLYRLTGGKLGPRTAAGDALLAEAEADPEGAGATETALRCTALLGFRALRRGPRAYGRRLRPPECAEFAAVASFAAACGSGVGQPNSGLGGNFGGDGGTGDWGGEGAAPPAARRRPGGGAEPAA